MIPDLVYQILSLLGTLLRFFGVGIFGVMLGWMCWNVYKKAEFPWQYQAVFLVVFFGFFAAMFWKLNPGVLAALVAGTGITFLVLANRKAKPDKVEPVELKKPSRRKLS
jgi:NhaP-type Na+/H+ or K+/H+ antiporter